MSFEDYEETRLFDQPELGWKVLQVIEDEQLIEVVTANGQEIFREVDVIVGRDFYGATTTTAPRFERRKRVRFLCGRPAKSALLEREATIRSLQGHLISERALAQARHRELTAAVERETGLQKQYSAACILLESNRKNYDVLAARLKDVLVLVDGNWITKQIELYQALYSQVALWKERPKCTDE
jgi:hypothetical protein